MAKDYVGLSRVLSHALRHEPWLYELELDADGSTAVEAVLAALREERPDWRAVGRRKSRSPVILRIAAAAAARAGVAFYAGNDKVWLADRISPQFIVEAPG